MSGAAGEAAAAAQKAKGIWDAAPPAPKGHPFLVKNKIQPHNARVFKGNLILPMRVSGKITCLQSITSEGETKFLKGGYRHRAYCGIGKDKTQMHLANDFVDAARLVEAGKTAVVCFGDMDSVEEALREKYPDAEIRRSGDVETAGIHADDVADSSAYREDGGGASGDDGARGTADRGGRGAEPANGGSYPDLPDDADQALIHPRAPVALGYDNGNYYYLSMETLQVERLTPAGHTPLNLRHLASEVYFWQRSRFFNKKVNWEEAADWLMSECKARGVYSESDERGRGAWLEGDTAVMHLGDRLIVGGQSVEIQKHITQYVYPKAKPLMAATALVPLRSKESAMLAELCCQLRWENPIMGKLLAGWIALAPLCGCLEWRPHLWLTGPSGSGKTWIYRRIVRECLKSFAQYALSSTTEAGIRHLLRRDALPVVFDEAESESKTQQTNIENILTLARQASSESGGSIFKGTAGQEAVKSYMIRSMFCFSSINQGVKYKADEARVSTLSLRANGVTDEEKDATREHFKRLREMVVETITPDFSARLFARSAKLAAVIRKNCDAFSLAAAEHFGSQRAGDQTGTLLAGAYSLYSQKEISPADALTWIQAHDWSGAESEPQHDHDDLLSYLMQFQLKYERAMGGTVERSVGELLEYAAGGDTTAEALLRRWGVKYQPADRRATVSERGLPNGAAGAWFATAHTGMQKMLAGTQWASKWGKALERVSGARHSGKENVRFHGAAVSKAVFVPMILEKRRQVEEVPY